MQLTVTSWNMQGAGYDKLTYMCNVYADFKDTNVFLLQETGNPNNPNGIQQGMQYILFEKQFTCVLVCEDLTAKSLRCTTAILIDDFLGKKFKQCHMIGAAGYRPAIFAIFEDIVIGTIHAPSIPGGEVSYIKGIYSRLNYECKCHNLPWAFMGDMNIDLAKDFPFEMCDGAKPRADSLNEIYIEKTSSSDVRCLLAYPKGNTQGSGGERTRKLDFAFFSRDFGYYKWYGMFNKKVLETITTQKYLSDHNMIGFTIL